jgi:predicted kinase
MSVELAILVGLQASGKSTFYRTRLAGTHELVSKDCFPNNRNPGRRQRQLVEAALAAGRPVAVDNTNATVEDRASLIALGRTFGAVVIGYYFESRLEDCMDRNRQRSGKARVPDIALFASRRRLVVPSLSEGFDRLFFVRLVAGNAFEVLAWNEGEVGDASR